MKLYADRFELLKFAAQCEPIDVAQGPLGMALEVGVYRGETLRFLREVMGRMVHGFDTFRGLPEDWRADDPKHPHVKGDFDLEGKVPPELQGLDGVQVEGIHVGPFAETLPPFLARTREPVTFLHVDCDLYSSTRDALFAIGARLIPAAIVVFDEFRGYPGWEQHEAKAWWEFLEAHGFEAEELGRVDGGQQAAFRIERRSM